MCYKLVLLNAATSRDNDSLSRDHDEKNVTQLTYRMFSTILHCKKALLVYLFHNLIVLLLGTITDDLPSVYSWK